MKANHTTLAILGIALVVLVVAVAGAYAISERPPALDPDQPYTTQANYDRKWVAYDFSPLMPGDSFSEQLQNPILLRVYDSGVYVADAGDRKIRRFSHDGRLINLIGNGRGQGPGEISAIADFFVHDDQIWVSDTRTQAVSRFNIDGRFISRFYVGAFPLRVAGLGDGLVLLLLGSAQLFEQVDTSGHMVAEFGEVITDQVQQSLSLSGNLLPLQQGFLYVPDFASYLYFFDAKGTLQRVVQTIDRQEFPGLESRKVGNGTAFYAPDPDIVTLDASTRGDELFLLTRFRNSDDDTKTYSVIDRYRLSDGIYQESIRLPFRISNAKIYRDRLYCWRDTSITVFSFK